MPRFPPHAPTGALLVAGAVLPALTISALAQDTETMHGKIMGEAHIQHVFHRQNDDGPDERKRYRGLDGHEHEGKDASDEDDENNQDVMILSFSRPVKARPLRGRAFVRLPRPRPPETARRPAPVNANLVRQQAPQEAGSVLAPTRRSRSLARICLLRGADDQVSTVPPEPLLCL